MARSSLSLALDLQVAAPKDEHSGGSRLPVERHDHAIALDRDTNLALGIVDALPPQKRLDIRFGSFDFLTQRDKAAPHVDDPDIGVIVFAFDAPDVKPGSGKEPRQPAMMIKAVEIALSQEALQCVRWRAASILWVVYRHRVEECPGRL